MGHVSLDDFPQTRYVGHMDLDAFFPLDLSAICRWMLFAQWDISATDELAHDDWVTRFTMLDCHLVEGVWHIYDWDTGSSILI